MTHQELDRLGPELERRCNAEIKRRFRSWSRYAVDQMLESTMAELAPDWSWITMSVIHGVPEIRLTQYTGKVDHPGPLMRDVVDLTGAPS